MSRSVLLCRAPEAWLRTERLQHEVEWREEIRHDAQTAKFQLYSSLFVHVYSFLQQHDHHIRSIWPRWTLSPPDHPSSETGSDSDGLTQIPSSVVAYSIAGRHRLHHRRSKGWIESSAEILT